MVEDTESLASTSPLAKLAEYKAATQKVNSSSAYQYKSEANPEYSGQPAPKQQTSKEVLSQRDQIQKTQEAVKITPENTPTKTPPKDFTLTDKNARPIDLKEVSKNISPKLQAGFSLGNEELSPNTNAVPITSGNIEDVYKKTTTPTPDMIKQNYFATPVINNPQENEAVSFLKVPFVGKKVTSTTIQSTSLSDIGTLIPIGGLAGGVKTGIVEVIRPSSKIAKTIVTNELQEGKALSQLSKIKGTSRLYEFEQGTAGKSGVLNNKIEQGQIQWIKQSNGRYIPVRPLMPKEVKITSPEKEVTTTIPYAVIQSSKKGITSIVTKGTTNLTPQYIAIKGIPPEVAQQMGLKQISGKGVSQVYKGKLTSNNIPILLEEIKTGNIKSSFDVLQYPTKDIAKGGGRYGMLSRDTDILGTNAFQRVTRPNIIRYFESKVELEKEIINKKTKTGMKSIGKISQSKGGAGQSGKANALLSQEEKNLVQTLTHEKTSEKPAILSGLREQSVKSSLSNPSYQTRNQRNNAVEELETIYLTKPQERSSKIEDLINVTKHKEEKSSVSELVKISKTTGISIVDTGFKKITGQSQKQGQSTITDIVQTQKITGKTPEKPPTGGRTGNPNDLLLNNKKRFKYTKINPKGNRLNYIGNQPINSIIGIYKRNDITYGKVKVEKLGGKDYSMLTKHNPKLITKGHPITRISKTPYGTSKYKEKSISKNDLNKKLKSGKIFTKKLKL